MPNDVTIREKVKEFIDRKEPFTSVDISNAIKRDGSVFARNREVRDWLHANINDTSLFGDYSNMLIDVLGGQAQATLYYPTFSDPDNYTNRDAVAITPDEFRDIQKTKIGSPAPNAAPDITQILSSTDSDVVASAVIKSTERIKIPGEITRKLGLKPGDCVDPAIIKTHTILIGELYVNKDYRISIPRKSVNWEGCPVKVILSSEGKVWFDKA